ncbi:MULTISPECIES: DUF1656 domain-containing protein [Tatumella]|uniref:DUF1656 domain-containing protein n=1 Tax=Tatumella punctata TaxID=399969 RepID=A0ABW1VKN5_9GAMM|nr:MULTISPECIES: DUF1656 domain-containing protein [unclassified Tatumella]MBS0855048.1 DUF1656 domain-containing protein [Tatumella sp. JGM16]MBS0876079.1 DUF1656 domain-containing protein [Tatumella sp. JGM82]MBS0890553.1 DUF1656 domain-containing protein [Tatumella sp. JGM94]MBS0892664.1 DUF1656 domain-containing protein [Tatumella sp. JGM130]MBS0901009.1 DUF1656 domain-containing protein [Tatumella sp. JGM100]
MNWSSHPPFSSLTELVLGDSLFFPPIFKPVLLGFFFWLMIHPLIRARMYSGVFWHPTLMDLSLFILCVAGAFGLLSLR